MVDIVLYSFCIINSDLVLTEQSLLLVPLLQQFVLYESVQPLMNWPASDLSRVLENILKITINKAFLPESKTVKNIS